MLDLFRQIRWQDLIDIAIVALILYRILLLIKGTKAAQMIAGLGVLLAASIFSRHLQLYTMDWLIQGFWSQLVIALIILFQPEIRSALARMGESPLLQFTSAEGVKAIEEIVKAAVAMSNRKIGALIVIQREVSLKDIIEVGTALDAKISKELLISIFHPSSPIHDGAVIIKGNRIVAAGCFLPISIGSAKMKSFGTRHKAGIGITEESDAVSIIVSEETGDISVAVNGRLKSPLDMGGIRDILNQIFTETKKKESRKK
ncbi:MAG: diadenylate cyclase CdaA [Nitrospirae bacterium]|nr:diadenylate cyclase CdaA [Nitrospirota bacterium]